MAITDKGDHTGNVFIDALAAYSFLDIGGDRNITYTFATGGNISAHAWAPITEKAQWQIALQQWVNVANITTQEVFSSDADLREAWVDTGQMTAAHGLGPDGLPYPSYHDLPQSGVGGPNGMYNRLYNTSFFPAAGVTTGGSGYWAFLHEIGRGLGLTPPFGTQDLENEPLFPGVSAAGDMGDFGYNQMVYTVLSLNHGQYISTAVNALTYGYPLTPMAFDIAAIQFLYGPNTTFQSGSDGYRLPDENADGTTWQCIWDTGGTDTIIYDGKKNATIDLRPATLVFGDPIAGGAISKADGIYGGFTIANGVVIENAIGGSGNDTLIGNSADNFLNGNAGDDAVVYSGPSSAYKVTDIGGNSFRVSGPDGADTISNVERLVFSDTTLSPSVASQGWDNAPGSPNLGVRSLPYVVAGVGDFNKDGRRRALARPEHRQSR